MKKSTASGTAKFHPIQIVDFGVKELFIRSYRSPDVTVGAKIEECSIRTAARPYDSKGKTIAVSLILESGVDADKRKVPYAMKIEILGIFGVDESRFPVEHISDWATNNAPLILYPYLREHAFGLSSRCGFKPLVLPLLEVPTFKIEKPKPTRKKKSN